ncbi:MAG: DUF3344 domain-containing protein [Methanoregula sp.]
MTSNTSSSELKTSQILSLTMPFIQNSGQQPNTVKFYDNTFYGTAYVTDTDLTHALAVTKDNKSYGVALKEQFVTADGTAIPLTPKGEDPSSAKVSYFVGNDSSKWQTGLSTYNIVSLGELYPGITVRAKAQGNTVEKHFTVATGADPNEIRIKILGTDKLRIADDGSLISITGDGETRMNAPKAFQEGRSIAIAYRLLKDNSYGFSVGNFDHDKPLLIDPSMDYSSYLGGSGDETVSYNTLAIDNEGNTYITGSTKSSNFPTTSGAYQTALAGTQNAFISKLNPTGTGLVYSTYLGGSSTDLGYGIAADSDGNAYVVGYSKSSNFPTTSGAYQTALAGTQDAFISKLNPTGTGLVYSTYLGGSLVEIDYGLKVDSEGNAYVVGYTTSTNFPTTSSAYQTTNAGGTEGFVSKLNPTGTGLVYSTYLGGSLADYCMNVALNSDGNAYVVGYTTSTNFPTTSGVYQTTYGGGNADAFVSKLNPAGTGLVYSTYLGGTLIDNAYCIAIDEEGNSYVSGQTSSTNYPTTSGAYQTTLSGTQDAIISKLNPTGTGLAYSTYLGGSGVDKGYNIVLDSAGNYAYVSGQTASTNFPTTSGAYQTANAGSKDIFITQFNFGPPTASFVADKTSGAIPLTVHFTDQSTASPTSWSWKFGDGSTSTLQNPDHTYESFGIYTVNLTATNDKGSNLSVRQDYITAGSSSAPVADFSVNKTTGAVPLTVKFTDNSTGTITNWIWDFGDSESSAEQNPTHTYTTEGSYSVNLTVTGSKGSDTLIRQNLISIITGSDLTGSAAYTTTFAHYNNTLTAKITNSGTQDVVAAFNVTLQIGSANTTKEIAGLQAGKNTSFTITDIADRHVNDTVEISLTVDPDNDITEADETNNEYSANATMIANGYTGHRWSDGPDLTTTKNLDLQGDLIYSFGNSGYGVDTAEWASSNLPIPDGATVKDARLYVPYCWDWQENMLGTTTMTFNGVTVPYAAHNRELKNWGDYSTYGYGVFIYNVTSQFNPSGNSASFSHGYAPIRGMNLVVTYQDANATEKQIFLNEGFDMLFAASKYYTTPETATAYAPFTSAEINMSRVKSARVITSVTRGSGRGTMLFNGTSWTSYWAPGQGEIGINTTDITPYLAATNNTVLMRSEDEGWGIEAYLAILKVEYNSEAGVPVVSFTGSPTTGTSPLSVQFTDTSLGVPTDWQWDFNNDGIIDSTEQNPAHTFTSAGTYTVNLTASNSYGSDTASRANYITVTASSTVPVANFTANATFGSMPMTVQFTDESTNLPTSWQWDFNNDGIIDSTEQNPAHTYTTAGTYTVNLTATNGDGSNTLSRSNYIAVIDPTQSKPYVSFSTDVTSGRIPLTVGFTDTTVGSPTVWSWSFGDGGTSTLQNPAHTYLANGTYSVSLTATGPGGVNSTTVTNAITVSDPLTSNSYNGGIPLTTVQNGTVTGGLWYDAYPGFATSASKTFTIPAHTSIKWARLYVDVYCGQMTNNYRGSAAINIDANGDSTYEIQKSETFNTTYSFPGDGGTGPVWLSNHMNRVTSDYLMWYDLTGAISGNTVNVQASTTKIDSSFDGRIKAMVLVVAYDDGTAKTVKYWVNQGHDTVNPTDTTYTGLSSFGTSALAGGWNSANMTTIYLASADGSYTFRGTTLSSGTPSGSYFGTNTWDITSLLTAGQDSSLAYDKSGSNYFKIPLALMSVSYTGNATYNPPVAAFSTEQTSTPLTVRFTDESTNSPTSWSWNFGDGNTSGETNPVHTFPSADTYNVSLTVSNSAGTSSINKSVIASENAGGTDLKVTAVTPNAGDIFANEANTITATVQNTGTEAAGPFVVRVSINDNATETSIAGLGSGSSNSFVITDPVIRALDDVVTINVTADSGNAINESSKTNNHFNLTTTVIYNGYKGKRYTGGSDVTTNKSYDIHGGLVSSSGDSEYKSGNDDWTTYTVKWTAADLPLPSGATVKEVRLYVPYTWDNTYQAPDKVHISFNGNTLPYQSWYHDKSGFGSWPDYVYGLMTYDATRAFSANAENTVTLSRDTNWAKISPYGFTLAVVYEDASATRKQIFFNEEFDLLGADNTNYATTPEEATAYVPFTNQTISTADVTRADLITFVPSGNGPEGDLLFNGNTINTSTWQYLTNTQVAENTRDVTAYLTATGNIAGIRSTTTSHATMAAAQEFLIIRYGPVAAFTQSTTSGDSPLTIRFTDQSIGSPTSWTWDFGDGSTSTDENPSHTYTAAGTYTVTLTATDSTGSDTVTKTDLVTVTAQSVFEQIFDIPGLLTGTDGDSQTVTIDRANVTVTGNTVNVTGTTGSGWDHFDIDLLTTPTTGSSTVNGTVAGVTAVTEPMTVPLSSVGTPTVQAVLGLERLPGSSATITTTLTQDPDAISLSAFSLAATNNGEKVNDIAYTVTFVKTGLDNSYNGGVIKNATIYMAVSPGWLTANGWTTANMTIMRHAENGTTSLLQTEFRGTDSSGNYLFSGYSPDGLSVFVLASLSPVNNDNGGGDTGGGGGGSSIGGGGLGVTEKESLIYDFLLSPPQSYSWVETTTISDSGTVTLTPLSADIPGMEELKATWQAEIPQKPDGGGKITTAIIRNLSDSMTDAYRQALIENGYGLWNISYSMQVSMDNIPVTKNATIEMTVPQDWVYGNGGLDQIRILRMDDYGSVQILDTAFCRYDRDSRYISFQASSPDGLCTFTLVSVTGSGTVSPVSTMAVAATAASTQAPSSDVVSSLVSGIESSAAGPYVLWIVVAVVILAACAMLVFFMRKRKENGK